MSTPLDDQQLQAEILSLVAEASDAAAADSPLGRMQVVIAGDAGGALHDPEEVLRQVAELVLGGLEVTTRDGARRRISFDGGQLARAFADAKLLEFMKVEISYVILAALGDFIFARSDVGAASQDVREALETLLVTIELQVAERVNTLGGRTQQRLMSVVREALGEETERKLIRIEQEDRRRKKDLIRELTRRILDAFTQGMEEFQLGRDRFQRQAEAGFEAATSLPQFNQILERNLHRLFDLVWSLRLREAIEQTLTQYEEKRALSGFDVMRALDYSQTTVIPQARQAFVGMLMGTYQPRARFVRGATLVHGAARRRPASET